MSKHIIDQTYHKYLHNRASQIGEIAALQETYTGKAQKDFKQIKNTEQKAEQKRIKDAEKAKQKEEQKRIKDAEKAKQKAEQKRIKDAEKDSKPKIHKRNVKESMKKQVASEQNWRCKKCGMSLPGNYEIDHVKPMKNGGVNDRINLQALCRNCHGEKTQREIAGIKQQKQLTMKQIFEQSGYTFAKDIRLRR